MIGILETAQKDAAKFDKGNNAAGTRLRKGMQLIKTKGQFVRDNVSVIKNIVA